MTSPPTPTLAELVRADAARIRADLEALVRIPSVSAHGLGSPELARSAHAVATLLADAGMATVRVLQMPEGAPAVIGHLPGPEGAPTVLLYAHHDVQPAGDPDAWSGDAFQPDERGGRLLGRGAADDKAGVVAHAAAVRALAKALPDGPAVGVTIFVEGEEEVGSPTLGAVLAAHADLLAADVMVIADSTNWEVGVPAFTISLRGLVEVFVEVRTHATEQHSGVVGGLFPDALTALCRVIASLHDDDGRVAVPGLVHGSPPEIDLDEQELRRAAGVGPEVASLGHGTAAHRVWQQPSITVTGLDAPSTNAAANVLLPTARAKVSMRIAPGQDAAAARQALTDHLTRCAPWGVSLTCEPGATGAAVALSGAAGVMEVARAAFAAAWDGVEPVAMGIGGSIPFIAELCRTYPQATILVVGPGDPRSNWHGPDESVSLEVLQRLAVAEALLLRDLATAPT